MDRPDGILVISLHPNPATLLVRSLGQGLPLGFSKEKPTCRCPAGMASNLSTPVRFPQEKLSRSGKLESITLPHASDTVTSSYMSQPFSFSSFLTSANLTPTMLTSNLNPIPVCRISLHLSTFNVRTPANLSTVVFDSHARNPSS